MCIVLIKQFLKSLIVNSKGKVFKRTIEKNIQLMQKGFKKALEVDRIPSKVTKRSLIQTPVEGYVSPPRWHR